jgi:hypothetical protein
MPQYQRVIFEERKHALHLRDGAAAAATNEVADSFC